MKKFPLVLAVLAMLVVPLAAQNMSAEKPLTYSVFFHTDELFEWWNNDKDIVTPYFEKKFNLSIDKDKTFWLQGQMLEQRINMFIATNTWPDVFVGTHQYMADIAPMAKDLSALVPKYMPNYWNRLTKQDKALSYYNGKIYGVFKYDGVDWSAESLADPYLSGFGNSLQIREDILAKLGYKFTPMREIQARITKEGRAVTLEDLKITPTPYSTFDEFYAFLKKIRDAGIADKNGKPVYPLTTRWGIQILGAGYNFSNTWVWNEKTKSAEGDLGSAGAYDFFKWWWKAYRDNLIDQDYVIQTNAQLEEKVNNGRAAMWMEPNEVNVQKSLTGIDPSWTVRPMPNPVNDPDNHGYWYPYTPGFFIATLSRTMSDETAIRFLKMWDYLYSEEGILDMVYGPASAGLRAKRPSDGRIVYSPAMQAAYDKKDKKTPGGPAEVGTAGPGHRWGNAWSRIAYFSGAPRYSFGLGPERASPPSQIALSRARRLFDSFAMALDGSVAGNTGAAATDAANYFNTTFKYNEIAQLLNAKTDQEFDAEWKKVMVKNETVGRYSQAVKDMNKVFAARGYK
jgi:hypothetical protein